MPLPFSVKDRYWNIFRKKELFFLAKSLRTWDFIFLFLIFSPIALGIFLTLAVDGSNAIIDTITIYQYFKAGGASSAKTIVSVSAIYHMICIAIALIVYAIRTNKAWNVYHQIQCFKKTSPNFYKQISTLVNLSLFLPFFSSRTYTKVFYFSSYKLPHLYSL